MANHNLPSCSDHFKGKLCQRMQDDLHLAGMATRTIHGYLRSVRQLADFCQQPPDQISQEQIRQWLIHLKVDRQYAYGSLRVAFSYRVKPSGNRRWVQCWASGEQFVRGFCQHILPSGFQKVRYYGFMSPNCKLKLKKVRWLAWLWKGWTYCLRPLERAAVEIPRGPVCRKCAGQLELWIVTGPQGQIVQRSQTSTRGPPCSA